MNFEKAIRAFREYTENYDKKIKMVERKTIHTYGVVSCSEYIANSLKLDKENIELAKLIALLHDIGRFEEAILIEKNSNLKSFDHAKYGVKILFKDGLIRKFIRL